MNTNEVFKKLMAEIDNIIEMAEERWDNEQVTGAKKLRDLLGARITSLQQVQTEVPNGKFFFPKYLYARTKDNKTIDMSYAPQDMTAVEYIRNDFVEQEQPEFPTTDEEVEKALSTIPKAELLDKYKTPDCIWEDKTIDQLAEEYVEGVKKCNDTPNWDLIHTAVCYGYGLGKNTRKEE